MESSSTKNDPSPPWYEGGLRFRCTQCGDCCGGAPGYVWVNQQEIEQLAARMQMEVAQFERRFVRRVGIRRSLKELPNGDCVFLHSERRTCMVYQDRPRQCRSWPFWDSNVRTPEDWQRTCEVCPGSGHGKLYQLEEIENKRQAIRI